MESDSELPLIGWIDDHDKNLIADWAYGRDESGKRTGVVVRKLRGKNCTTTSDLMNEFGAALQFFYGFGNNYNALFECLCYLDEWLPGPGYILLFERAELVLGESPEVLPTLASVLADTLEWWSKPIDDNPPYNRPALPFRVVLQASFGSPLERALRAEGVRLESWSGQGKRVSANRPQS